MTHNNGCVYETFGVMKRFPVKLRGSLIWAVRIINALNVKCFIYDVELNPASAG